MCRPIARAARWPLGLSGRSKSRATGSSQPDLAWRSSVSVFIRIPVRWRWRLPHAATACPRKDATRCDRFVERDTRDRGAGRKGGEQPAGASPPRAARTRRDRPRAGSAGRTPAPAARGRCGRRRRCRRPASRRAAWSTVGLGQGTPSITTSRSEWPGTSTPSRKASVPISEARGSSRKISTSVPVSIGSTCWA